MVSGWSGVVESKYILDLCVYACPSWLITFLRLCT
jgi:hypothetical protein